MCCFVCDSTRTITSRRSGLNLRGAYIVYCRNPYLRTQCQSRIFSVEAKGSSISMPTTSEMLVLVMVVLGAKIVFCIDGQAFMLVAG